MTVINNDTNPLKIPKEEKSMKKLLEIAPIENKYEDEYKDYTYEVISSLDGKTIIVESIKTGVSKDTERFGENAGYVIIGYYKDNKDTKYFTVSHSKFLVSAFENAKKELDKTPELWGSVEVTLKKVQKDARSMWTLE